MIKTFRAKSIQQALRLVRQELGADAEVLHTRRVRRGLFGKLFGGSKIEVAATLRPAMALAPAATAAVPDALPDQRPSEPSGLEFDHRDRYREQLHASFQGEPAGDSLDRTGVPCTESGDPLATTSASGVTSTEPTVLLDVLSMLLDAGVESSTARGVLDRIRDTGSADELRDATKLAEMVRQEVASQRERGIQKVA